MDNLLSLAGFTDEQKRKLSKVLKKLEKEFNRKFDLQIPSLFDGEVASALTEALWAELEKVNFDGDQITTDNENIAGLLKEMANRLESLDMDAKEEDEEKEEVKPKLKKAKKSKPSSTAVKEENKDSDDDDDDEKPSISVDHNRPSTSSQKHQHKPSTSSSSKHNNQKASTSSASATVAVKKEPLDEDDEDSPPPVPRNHPPAAARNPPPAAARNPRPAAPRNRPPVPAAPAPAAADEDDEESEEEFPDPANPLHNPLLVPPVMPRRKVCLKELRNEELLSRLFGRQLNHAVFQPPRRPPNNVRLDFGLEEAIWGHRWPEVPPGRLEEVQAMMQRLAAEADNEDEDEDEAEEVEEEREKNEIKSENDGDDEAEEEEEEEEEKEEEEEEEETEEAEVKQEEAEGVDEEGVSFPVRPPPDNLRSFPTPANIDPKLMAEFNRELEKVYAAGRKAAERKRAAEGPQPPEPPHEPWGPNNLPPADRCKFNRKPGFAMPLPVDGEDDFSMKQLKDFGRMLKQNMNGFTSSMPVSKPKEEGEEEDD